MGHRMVQAPLRVRCRCLLTSCKPVFSQSRWPGRVISPPTCAPIRGSLHRNRHRRRQTYRYRQWNRYRVRNRIRTQAVVMRRARAVKTKSKEVNRWWTRLRPIRTVSQVEFEFVVFTQDAFQYQRIGPEADTMRRLGMSFRAIADALGVDEKQVRKALRVSSHCGRWRRLVGSTATHSPRQQHLHPPGSAIAAPDSVRKLRRRSLRPLRSYDFARAL